ncbi:MAG TPA: hypothetical protein VLT89_01385 [Usitatibacter sp.]|nr:hypothetical protein [Usitatibacter sp.]
MIRAALAAAAAAFAFAAQAAEPVAFVADLRGSATIEGDGNLGFLAELAAGTRLLLGTGASVAVTYAATGAEFTFVGPGEFVVTATEVRAEKGAKPSRRTVQALPDPSIVGRLANTATASLRMRGLPPPAPAPSALEYPVDTRVTTLQPVLRWKGDPAASGYTVRLVDEAGKEVWKATAKSANVKAGVKLAPAAAYTWSVATAKGRLGEARFETVSAENVARAERSRAEAKTFPDRVMHAFLLQDLGAAGEAREAWAALARERPDLAELAVLAR